MTQLKFAYYIVLLVGGSACAIFMVQQILDVLKKGLIKRSRGLKPLTPNDGAPLYWLTVAFLVLSTALLILGIWVVITRLISGTEY